ncbi:hypothetical protein GCM10007170_38480 [Arthrobacter liuii]|uniref:Uncharacterized protein n=1 Tax=Arthrobacter liuii TaxID=1476996 RepID=A0ABQ2AZ43_9MICC|nr:hypothetical protein GCM10007170_38480 [Arthrobacter liuii]
MRWAGLVGTNGSAGKAGSAGRDDDGSGVGAVVDPFVGGAPVRSGFGGTVTLQLTVWEQWL